MPKLFPFPKSIRLGFCFFLFMLPAFRPTQGAQENSNHPPVQVSLDLAGPAALIEVHAAAQEIKDPRAFVRRSAAERLGEIGSETVLSMARLPDMTSAAALALGSLRSFLSDGQVEVRRADCHTDNS